MKIKINDEYKDYNFKNLNNLFDVISEIQKDPAFKHQVITEVILNGEKLFPTEEILKSTKIFDDCLIEIISMHIRDVTIQGVLDSLRIVPKIKDDCKEIIANMRKGETASAMKLLSECLSTINWFNLVLSLVEKILGVEISKIKNNNFSLVDGLYKLIEILKMILSGIEQNDKIRISDALEYELIPLLDDFISLLPDLIKELDRRTIH